MTAAFIPKLHHASERKIRNALVVDPSHGELWESGFHDGTFPVALQDKFIFQIHREIDPFDITLHKGICVLTII